MKFFFICFLYFTFLISCVDDQKSYECIDSVCLEDENGSYETANDCIESCIENLQNSNVVVTFFYMKIVQYHSICAALLETHIIYLMTP